MKSIGTRIVLVFGLLFFAVNSFAQNTIGIGKYNKTLDSLNTVRANVENHEKELLKLYINDLNRQLKKGKISEREFENEKNKLAELHAQNIQSRKIILDEMIEYLERNSESDSLKLLKLPNSITKVRDTSHLSSVEPKDTYYINEYFQPYFAVGFSNSARDNSLSDLPYKPLGSRFLEMGVNKRHAFKKRGSLHFRYGIGVNIDGYKSSDNEYFVMEDNKIRIEEHLYKLKKSKLRRIDLVVPLHLEFQKLHGSKKRNGKMHYSYYNSWNFGIGGYAGVNLETKQILKYTDGGKKIESTQILSGGVNKPVYGLSAFVGKQDFSLYVRYALSDMFKDNIPHTENTIAIGVRFAP